MDEIDGAIERTAQPDAQFAIKLPGPGLGEVAVGDVIEFLRGIVDLVAYGAAADLGRPIGSPGRRGASVEGASKVRLVSLRSGSLVAELQPAPPSPITGSIGLDVESLSERGLNAVFETVDGTRMHPELAPALRQFARRMAARRPGASVVFLDRRHGRERESPLDEATLERLDIPGVHVTRVGRDQVTGRIFEANVESDEAHIRMPTGESVKVTFDSDFEPEVKRLLGDRASLRGEVEYDASTRRVREIRVMEILAGDQISMDFEGIDFWRDPSLSELAEQAGARPVADPDELHFADASDGEWEQLYDALRSR